jgi:hypothetical protein
MTASEVAIWVELAPIAERPAIAIENVATEPVVEATVPAIKGLRASDRALIATP